MPENFVLYVTRPHIHEEVERRLVKRYRKSASEFWNALLAGRSRAGSNYSE